MWRNILLTAIIFILSVGVFYTTIFDLNPLGTQAILAYSAFYISFFLAITSFFTFLFFFGAELFHGKKLGSRDFLRAVRRSVLVASFFSVCTVLQYFRLLGQLEAIILICFLASLEWVFMGSTNKEK